MAKKTNLILKQTGFKSFSEAIRTITGWTQKEFETQKRVMRMRVSNLNKLAGTNLSAIEELYYKVKYEDRVQYYQSKGKPILPRNPIQQALLDIKTTKVNVDKYGNIKSAQLKQIEAAKQFVLNKFEGLAKTYKSARDIRDKLINGEITAREANDLLSFEADRLKVLKTEDPTAWASAQDEEIGSP